MKLISKKDMLSFLEASLPLLKDEFHNPHIGLDGVIISEKAPYQVEYYEESIVKQLSELDFKELENCCVELGNRLSWRVFTQSELYDYIVYKDDVIYERGKNATKFEIRNMRETLSKIGLMVVVINKSI